MQITFTGRNNLEVTSALKNTAQEKLQPLSRHHKDIESVSIVFHVENINHVAEATLHINGTTIHASTSSDDMYKAIDELAEKLSRQLGKHKEKHTGHR